MGSRWPGSGGGGGGGISGLTSNRIPYAATSSTLKDGPFTFLAGPDRPSENNTILDGGSTSGNGALVLQPSSGYGCYGAELTFDNSKIDGTSGGSLLWNFMQLASTYLSGQYQKWFSLLDQLTVVGLVSPQHNWFLGDNGGNGTDPGLARLTVGGNIRLTGGGKVLYTAAVPSNWAASTPATSLSDAIDRIVAAMSVKP
jgi:hypothetical protein